MSTLTVLQADYRRPSHARAVVDLLDAYARAGGRDAVLLLHSQGRGAQLVDELQAIAGVARVDVVSIDFEVP